MAGDLSISTLGGAFISDRNAIINPNFSVNQRAVSGTVVLSAGSYGHDRWKAGAGGCTYTFATSNNVTTLTISAGTLMQVIEGINLQSGTYTLSWTGTATGRVDSGSYGASGVTGTAVGGTNQTIEFGTGTLSKVQYEPGNTVTDFVRRQYGTELALCQRYYYRLFPGAIAKHLGSSGYNLTTSTHRGLVQFPVTMRTEPTALEQSGTANQYMVNSNNGNTQCTSVPTFGIATTSNASFIFTTGATLTAGSAGFPFTDGTNGASAYLGWSAEL